MHPFFTTFINIIIFAGIVQGFYLAIILTTKKNKNRKSNKLLALLLIVLSTSILHSVLASGNIHTSYRIKEPLILLIGPLLLFYTRENTGTKTANTKIFPHFIPFILFLLFVLPEMITGSSSAYTGFMYRNSAVISVSTWVLIVIQYGFYWITTVHTIYKHTKTVESEFSIIEGKSLSWLKTFLHVFGILLILFTGTVLFVLHGGNYSDVNTIVAFGLSLAIFCLGYEGLFQEEIFTGISKPIETGTNFKLSTSETIYSNQQKISNAEENNLHEKVLRYFNEKKPYLDETLTLTKLAEQLNVTRNQLSSTINNKSGSNFYNFVNKYRIEEVKRLLADPKNKDFTILSLAFEAGFSSKSSFHNIFKKFTGMTPTEYQNKIKLLK